MARWTGSAALAGVCTVFLPQGASAQIQPDASDPTIIVTATPIDRSRADSLQGVSILEEDELRRRLEPTLGETLAREPGVSSTFFGPGASRPLIRGQGGERIRILNDGIGNFDVSTTSVDHVVAADPLSAERIEIVRGPAALLYGDSASGGVVNVIEGRIPRRSYDGLAGEALGYAGSNADALTATAELDWSPARSLTVHADAFWRRQDDYGDGRGLVVGNSALRSSGAAGGASWIGEGGFIGANVSAFEARYEIPGDIVFIDAKQTRGDFAAEHRIQAFGLESVRVRAGYADYSHDEIDDRGVALTTFANQEFEGRIDLRHQRLGPLRGAVGAQLRHRKFEAVGFEAFVPPSGFNQIGLFLFERAELGRLAIEGGIRYSRTRLETEGFDNPSQFVAPARITFDTLGGSLAVGYEPFGGALIGLSIYRTARAPALEELFANGPHAATGTYEIGNPALRQEVARGAELTLRFARDRQFSIEANAFYTDYSGYIVERENGAQRLNLPVLVFEATDARFWGFELAGEALIASGSWGALRGDILADMVRAQDTARDLPLPRIPPFRIIAGLDYDSGSGVTARFEIVRAARQDRVSQFEQVTPGYIFLNANLSVHLSSTVTAELRASNLTDHFAQAHTSFLRSRAPLPGRDFRLLVRYAFD